MQLKKGLPKISGALAVATGTLLHGVGQVLAADSVDNKASISHLEYLEADRVAVKKTQLLYEKDFDADNQLSLSFVYDTMTGVSPNGRRVDFSKLDSGEIPVTTASGFSFQVTGDTTADPRTWVTAFSDRRYAGSGDWTRKFNSNLTGSFSASFSDENDYRSYGGALKFVNEFNSKLSALTFGVGRNNDQIRPVSKIQEAKSVLWCEDSHNYQPIWIDCVPSSVRYEVGNKTSVDAMIGYSQIWNKRTIWQLNYGYTNLSGYLTDPYKLVSVFDPVFGESAFIYEKRPEQRNMHRLFFKLVKVIRENVARISYRFFWDDWGIRAHTVDLKYRYEMKKSFYLRPRFRYSYQNSAYFFQNYIDSNSLEPEFVSADHRVGEQITITAGLKVGFDLSDVHRISIKSDYVRQMYPQKNLPAMNTLVFQFIYATKF
ncbi:MAG: DUF3570 domain-containing protein [Gammaproteobacteria bacterium]|nr:DUF3570 domain-containing protein [Gammaproteobacteria bacterium]